MARILVRILARRNGKNFVSCLGRCLGFFKPGYGEKLQASVNKMVADEPRQRYVNCNHSQRSRDVTNATVFVSAFD